MKRGTKRLFVILLVLCVLASFGCAPKSKATSALYQFSADSQLVAANARQTYTLRYNPEYFTPMRRESDDRTADFAVQGLGVDHVTVRLVRADRYDGTPANCYDYFNLERVDGAEAQDLLTLRTDAGYVTYYVTTSNPAHSGYPTQVYYAINLGQVAFCGVMDVIDDKTGVMLDRQMADDHAADAFERGIARQVFENLFQGVTSEEYRAQQT